MAKQYDEKDIESLSGLSGVRKKASMYIGPPDTRGVFTILREVADNTVDEALAGRNSGCVISIGVGSDEGSYVVADKGEGIPVKNITVTDDVNHKKHEVSAFRAVVSLVHTGAKFGTNKAYAASRGTHGVGIKATNALSKDFQVWTCRDGKWYTTAYKQGKLTKDVQKCKAPTVHGMTFERGTVVRFVPDEAIFKPCKMPFPMILEWCQTTALLTPKFKILLKKGDKKKTFYEKDGAKDYLLNKLDETKASALGPQFRFSNELVDLAVVFTDYEGSDMRAHTNGLYNSDGGFHESALYRGIMEALEPYRKKKQKFTSQELKDGIIGLLNVKLSVPTFDSQSKNKLIDVRAKGPLAEVIAKAFKKFFAENKATAQRLCERCSKLQELHKDFLANKKGVLKKLGQINKIGFPEKFASALRCNPEDRETYFVEGDSAGGTAKQARDKSFQEILPLKGKIKNSIRDAKGALNSEEVINLFAAIGFNPKKPDSKPRTGKVILLMDPDPDGGHIESLTLSCVYKFMPTLFDKGMVYTVDSPEFFAKGKDGKCYTAKTLDKMKEKAPKGAEIKHIKGWGEIPPEDLKPLAMDPETRKLIRIVPAKGKDKLRFEKLMGSESDFRKEMLGM